MSLEQRKGKARKGMFGAGAKIVWAKYVPDEKFAREEFEKLLKLRKEYVSSGGELKGK